MIKRCFKNRYKTKICHKMCVFHIASLNNEIHKHTPSSHFLMILNLMLNLTVFYYLYHIRIIATGKERTLTSTAPQIKTKMNHRTLEPFMILRKIGISGTYRSRRGNQQFNSSMSRTQRKMKINSCNFFCCFSLLFSSFFFFFAVA